MTLLSIPQNEILTGFLVLVRVISMVGVSPVFGSQNVPVRIRLAFSIFLTIALLPVVPAMPPLTHGMFDMAARVVHETFIGIAIGFLVSIMFSVVSVSGQLIGTSAGMNLASQFDPTLNSEATSLVTLKLMLLMLVFLAADFHHVILRGLVYSFTAIPPGGGYGGARAGFYLAMMFSSVFQTAVTMALPVILVVLLVNLGMAIIARVAPTMNVFFAIGGSVNELVSMLILALSLPVIVVILNGMFSGMEDRLADLIRQFR